MWVLLRSSNRAATGKVTLFSECAVERRGFPVGESPTRQGSLQPVAIVATKEVTRSSKPTMERVIQ